MLVMTTIAILAVDFKIFPRAFGKCEDFGVGLVSSPRLLGCRSKRIVKADEVVWGCSLGDGSVDGCGCRIVCFLSRDHFRFPLHPPNYLRTPRVYPDRPSLWKINAESGRRNDPVLFKPDDCFENAGQGGKEELAYLGTWGSKGDHGEKGRLSRKSHS